MFFHLAWRNIWRNRHRTLITTASVFFAVILVLFIRSLQLGTYDHMITNTLQLNTGFIQVQGKDFQETRSLENSMVLQQGDIRSVLSVEGVTTAVPRIESFALAASEERSRGIMLTGIDPEAENRMNELSNRILEGNFLHENSEQVIVAKGVAEYLDVSIGDTLIFLSQGFYGVSAAAAFAVGGIVDLPLPELNNSMVYTSLQNARWFYSMPDRVTSLAIMIDNPNKLNSVAEELKGFFTDEQIDVITWRELLPELVQVIELDNAQGIVMLGILYMVVGFGVFGTVMMMMVERRREFAVMLSVGLKNWRLGMIVLIESLAIAFMGTIAGVIISVPILLYMSDNPIELTGTTAHAIREFGFEPLLPFSVDPSIFLNQGLVVLVITLIACLYPIYSVNRIKISNELKS